MKKTLAVLAVLLAAGLAIGGVIWQQEKNKGFEVAQNGSVTITSPMEYVTSGVFNDKEALSLVEQLLTDTLKQKQLPGEAELLAELTHTGGDGSRQQFQIYGSNGALYATDGKKIRELVPELFYRLVNENLKEQLYLLSRPTLPSFYLNGADLELAPIEGQYSYLTLGGEWQGESLEPHYDEEPRRLSLQDEPWPTLVWEDPANPGMAQAVVHKDGQPFWKGTWQELEQTELGEGGMYQVWVRVKHRLEYGSMSAVYTFTAWVDDAVSFRVEGADTYPGEMVVLRAFNVPEGESVLYTGSIQFVPTFFQEQDGSWVALLPLSYFNGPGEYGLRLECAGAAEEFVVRAKEKSFQIQDLEVEESTAEETINSRNANIEFEESIAPLRMVADSTRHWQEGFAWPVEGGKVTTEFGMIRYVNGAPTSTRHGAIDFALPLGTPVSATNAGRVLYAGFLQLTGNTVVIEHGYGLKSWHYHMDSLAVETGEMVEKGQKIGEVGSTGFSTGPHLHFGMSVKNVFVNPEGIIEDGVPGW